MRLLTALVALAATASAAVLAKDHAIDVKLISVGGTLVKATVTNSGAKGVQIPYLGTILNANTAQGLVVRGDNGSLPFIGTHAQVSLDGITSNSLTTIKPGENLDVVMEVAASYDLSAGGIFTVSASGALPFAEIDANHWSNSHALTYQSNELEIQVDGARAAMLLPFNPLAKRATIQEASCDAKQLQFVKSAFSGCRKLAVQAANHALSGPSDLFFEYFKTNDASVRANVAGRFKAIARECSYIPPSITEWACKPPPQFEHYCPQPPKLSAVAWSVWTAPSTNLAFPCPSFYGFQMMSTVCHKHSSAANVVLHEFAHLPGVYEPATADLAYGFPAVTFLTAEQALNNADSFSVYAGAVNDC